MRPLRTTRWRWFLAGGGAALLLAVVAQSNRDASTAPGVGDPVGTPAPPKRSPEPTVLVDADVDNKTVFDLSKPNPFDRPFTWGKAEFTLPQGATVTTLEWDERGDNLRHQRLTIKVGESVLEYDTTSGKLLRFDVSGADQSAFDQILAALEAAK